MAYASTHLTQSLRGYPTQSLRGLGAASGADTAKQMLIAQAKKDFIAACDELVSGTKKACDKLRANSTGVGLLKFGLNPLSFLEGGRTKEVCDNIEANVKDNCDKLLAVSTKGPNGQVLAVAQPFFMRFPEKAQALLATIQKNADDLIQDHKQLMTETGFATLFGAFGFDSLKDFIKQVIDKLLEILQFLIMALLEGATKFPVAAAAIAATLGFVVWFKFLR
jgi:hypothetical protein